MSLRIGGTGMAIAISRILHDRFATTGQVAPATLLDSLGSSGGLAALSAGRIDMALSARPLRPAEEAEGLCALPLGRTPVAFATRRDTSAEGLTLADAGAMLDGDRATWPDGRPVRLVQRDRSETDWILLAALSPAMRLTVERALARRGMAMVNSDQENADLLESLPGGFGLMTLGQAMAERRRVRMLALDGVEPTLAALSEGRYRLARSAFAVLRADALPAARDFMHFLETPAAHAVLRDNGFVPIAGIPA